MTLDIYLWMVTFGFLLQCLLQIWFIVWNHEKLSYFTIKQYSWSAWHTTKGENSTSSSHISCYSPSKHNKLTCHHMDWDLCEEFNFKPDMPSEAKQQRKIERCVWLLSKPKCCSPPPHPDLYFLHFNYFLVRETSVHTHVSKSTNCFWQPEIQIRK